MEACSACGALHELALVGVPEGAALWRCLHCRHMNTIGQAPVVEATLVTIDDRRRTKMDENTPRMSYASTPRLVWVDIETTGLNFDDAIIEVGLVVTTPPPELSEVNEVSLLVKPPAVFSKENVWAMHCGENGLFDEAQKFGWQNLSVALTFLQGWLAGVNYGHEPGPMCGSSVHFDRERLARVSPRFVESTWTYRNFDVSTLIELAYRLFGGSAVVSAVSQAVATVGSGNTDKHRAVPDLHYSIAVVRELCKLYRPTY